MENAAFDERSIERGSDNRADAELIRRYAVEKVPAHAELGTSLVSVEDNAVTLSLTWQERLVGNPENGALMGGVITTLFDHAAGLAAAMALDRERYPEATLDLRIDYLKPSRKQTAVHVRAECYKTTRQVAFVRGVAFHPDKPDDLIATAVSTFMIAMKKAAPQEPSA